MRFTLTFLLALFLGQNSKASTWVVINSQPDGNGSFLDAINNTNDNPGNELPHVLSIVEPSKTGGNISSLAAVGVPV